MGQLCKVWETFVRKLAARKPWSGNLLFDRKNGRTILSEAFRQKSMFWKPTFCPEDRGESLLQSSPVSFRRTFRKIVLWKGKSSSRKTNEGLFPGNYCSKAFRQKPYSGNLLFDRKIVENYFTKFSREFSENFRKNCPLEKQIEFS